MLRGENSRREAENQRMARSVAALRQQAADAKLARQTEAARAERWRERSADLSATIEHILTGDIQDAPLDPDLADWINGLRDLD